MATVTKPRLSSPASSAKRDKMMSALTLRI